MILKIFKGVLLGIGGFLLIIISIIFSFYLMLVKNISLILFLSIFIIGLIAGVTVMIYGGKLVNS